MCRELSKLANTVNNNHGRLNLTNGASIQITAKRFHSRPMCTVRQKCLSKKYSTRSGSPYESHVSSADYDLKIIFSKTNAKVIDDDGNVKLTNRVGDLYYEKSREHYKIATDTESTSFNTQGTLMSWYRLLEHVNFKDLLGTKHRGTISGIKIGQRNSKT